MPPSKLTPSKIYIGWRKMKSLRTEIPQCRVNFKVQNLVRIRKEKVMFAKRNEKTFSTEIFNDVKVIQRVLVYGFKTVA